MLFYSYYFVDYYLFNLIWLFDAIIYIPLFFEGAKLLIFQHVAYMSRSIFLLNN
jgi:hypothetical protein